MSLVVVGSNGFHCFLYKYFENTYVEVCVQSSWPAMRARGPFDKSPTGSATDALPTPCTSVTWLDTALQNFSS